MGAIYIPSVIADIDGLQDALDEKLPGTPPPAPSLSASSASPLSTAYLACDNDGSNIRHDLFFFNRQVEQTSTTTADRNSVKAKRGDNVDIGSSTSGQMRVCFFVYADAFSVKFKKAGNQMVVRITNLSDEVPTARVAFDSSNPGDIDWDGITTGNVRYLTFDYGADRQLLLVELDILGSFYGVNLGSAVDWIAAGPAGKIGPIDLPDYWAIGDSILGAANAGGLSFESYVKIATRLSGAPFRVRQFPAGGSGFIEEGDKMIYEDRVAPPGSQAPGEAALPGSSWLLSSTIAGAGTVTVTHDGETTDAIAFNATEETFLDNMQAALTATFGSRASGLPKARVCWTDWGWSMQFDEGADEPTFGTAGVTGTFTVTGPWIGDIAKSIELDADGNEIPGILHVQAGNNDSDFAEAAIQSALVDFMTAFNARWPGWKVVMQGPPPTDNALSLAQYRAADTALYEQCQTSLAKINGYVPYISPWSGARTDTGWKKQKDWFTGTGREGATTGDGVNDLASSDDGIHPSGTGQMLLGVLTWCAWSRLFARGV